MPHGEPWEHSPVPDEHRIKGLHSVRLTVESVDDVRLLFTEVLSWREVGRYEIGGEHGPVTVFQMGAGGVRRVPFRVPTEEEHCRWVPRLREARMRSTDVIDRYYFRSIYFPIPSGILFELATDGPGFATDEPVEALGERLALPPFLEPRRAEIEADLRPLD